jgi:hypothetical protein
VTIVVDTNILPRGGDADSLEINVLLALGRETGHHLALPSLALEEAVSERRREIETSFDKLLAAHRAASKFANLPPPTEFPVPGELAREYENTLRQRFTILPMPPDAGDEALRREAHRLRPAREGRGARDVAIWLTAKASHAESGGPTYFVSDNVKDFASSGGQSLHPELEEEVGRLAGDFHYCRSVTELLDLFAERVDAFVDVEYLNAHPEAAQAVVAALHGEEVLDSLVVPSELDVPKRSAIFVASPVQARALEVRDSRSFRLENRRVAVAWTRWEFDFTAGVVVSPPAGKAQLSTVIDCLASVQLLVRADLEDAAVDIQALAVAGLRAVADSP